jgi:putative DNA methylase
VSDAQAPIKRKLIEVALPLEAINRESAREKSIRHGHPSTLHLWWARRPLAACRAVLFAQLVDDPSAHPDRFPTEQAQAKERRRLFDLIERLVKWENTNNEGLLRQAYEEIARCFDGKPPVILDPFAGGGSIPLEAQRLGLEVHASDLNPVAVLINKAMIEIPPKFAGSSPVFPGAAESRLGEWPRATGLAEDVRRYGQWICDEAEKRLGHLYPKAIMPDGTEANVIAWIWARTVRCSNPACGVETPLVNSFTVSRRKGREAHARPVVREDRVEYEIDGGARPIAQPTVSRSGAVCVACGATLPLAYVRAEGKKGQIGSHLICVVAEGHRRRTYLPPARGHVEAADKCPLAEGLPEWGLAVNPRAITAPNYGFDTHDKLYTRRQGQLLTTLVELIGNARERCLSDSGDATYADSIAVYQALLLGRVANRNSSQSFWHAGRETVEQVFGRNAMPMMWVYAEANPFSSSSGNVRGQLDYLTKVVQALPASGDAVVRQLDAARLSSHGIVFATDPPYYDNVPYADLSDFFYVWHRSALRRALPSLYGTMVTPKNAELIAEPARTGSWESAAAFFETGLRRVFESIVDGQHPGYPFTMFYAFKQAETSADGTASTGWETMLQALT